MSEAVQDKKSKFVSLLFREIKNGYKFDADMAELLVKGGKVDVNSLNENGVSTLMSSVHNDGYAIDFLLSKKAKPNIPSRAQEPLPKTWKDGAIEVCYPIMWATRYFADKFGDPTIGNRQVGTKDVGDVIQKLLDAGADIDKRDAKGRNAIFYFPQLENPADDYSYEEETRGSRHKRFVGNATKRNDALVKAFQKILDTGININRKDADGNTPMHLFAERGDLELVKLLMTKDAKQGVKNGAGKKPADLVREKYANCRKQIEILQTRLNGPLDWEYNNDEYQSEWESVKTSLAQNESIVTRCTEILTLFGEFAELKPRSQRTPQPK